MRRTLLGWVHSAVDDLAVSAFRLRPLHPLRLRMGPLHGDPTIPVGGLPDAAPLEIVLPNHRAHLVLRSPVRSARAPNDLVHLDSWAPRKASQGTVVFSPFWQIPGPWALTQYISLARRMGFHAVVYTPPDHMQRTPKGYFSGERVLGWDLPYMEDLLQLVCAELCAVVDALKRQGKPVHLVGLSLGGLYAAMAAVCGARVDSLSLITPAVDVQHAMDGSGLGRRYKRLLTQRGDEVPEHELLTRLGFPYRARSFDRPLPASRIFLAHGAHDSVVPHDVTTTLGKRWRVPVHSYASGHMTLLFLQPALGRDLRHFLRKAQERALKRR